jgi:nucleotide-binding universal stress UspA family protein
MNIRSILLPTDFSDCAGSALAYATQFARQFDASIICLHVVEPLVPAVGYAGITEPLPMGEDVSEQLEDAAARELPKISKHQDCTGLKVEEVMAHGDAASEIVRIAKERGVDLIVIASHGRTGWGRILFGSTAESVVRHAHCPVLVVKPERAEDS